MSSDPGRPPNVPQVVSILIEFDVATQRLNVNGPPDKVLALGMLEFAKHAMLQGAQSRTSPIVGAAMVPPFLPRRQ